MYVTETDPKKRRRAPSKRSLETRARIFDAAEALFAERGFEGTATRDIARQAEVTPALVSFHGGSKLALFEAVVERRATVLAEDRMTRLAALRAAGHPDLRALLESFSLPLLERARDGGPQWLAYARLVAIVSADAQWRSLTERCFDPAVQDFAQEIGRLFPGASRDQVAVGMVFSVSAMLSLVTSEWRIGALAGGGALRTLDSDRIAGLLDYCEAGLRALMSKAG